MARVIEKIVIGSSRADKAFNVCIALIWALYAIIKLSYS